MEHNTSCVVHRSAQQKNDIFVSDREPSNMKHLTSSSPNAAPVSTKGQPFPEQMDQVEEDWHVIPFMMRVYVFVFELQREVWALLNSAMSLNPSAFYLQHNPDKVF